MAKADKRKGGELLSTAQLAERWKVSEWKVRQTAHSGELPYQRFGYRTMRFRLADVEIYEARHRQQS